MDNSQKPIARKDGLVIQEMPDEILVYDTETNKAHCLNQTAAFVWQACDGNNSVADIAKLFGNQSKSPVQEDLIWLAIDQLNANNLLAKELKANFNGQTRREVIKKIGLAAVVALPIVSSLVAPSAALAVTCSGQVMTVSCSAATAGCSCTPCQGGANPGGIGTCNGGTLCLCSDAGTITIETKDVKRSSSSSIK